MMKHLFDDGNLSWLRWPEVSLVVILTAVKHNPNYRCRAFYPAFVQCTVRLLQLRHHLSKKAP
jgi:hypothetical protein